jgi:hypothetical protein
MKKTMNLRLPSNMRCQCAGRLVGRHIDTDVIFEEQTPSCIPDIIVGHHPVVRSADPLSLNGNKVFLIGTWWESIDYIQ